MEQGPAQNCARQIEGGKSKDLLLRRLPTGDLNDLADKRCALSRALSGEFSSDEFCELEIQFEPSCRQSLIVPQMLNEQPRLSTEDLNDLADKSCAVAREVSDEKLQGLDRIDTAYFESEADLQFKPPSWQNLVPQSLKCFRVRAQDPRELSMMKFTAVLAELP